MKYMFDELMEISKKFHDMGMTPEIIVTKKEYEKILKETTKGLNLPETGEYDKPQIVRLFGVTFRRRT